jgi:membrane dipeptidase
VLKSQAQAAAGAGRRRRRSAARVARTDALRYSASMLPVSPEALALYRSSDVIDLHVDTFIWHRLGLYDLTKRHTGGVFGTRLYGQVDLPRIHEARVTGAYWSITTNPLRRAEGRGRAFDTNLQRLTEVLASDPGVAIVASATDYANARSAGTHGAFVGIQGGNALDAGPDALERLRGSPVTRVTLVHLSTSTLGVTSAPKYGLGFVNTTAAGPPGGLTAAGLDAVRILNDQRIFVDLAHMSRAGFWDAVKVHAKDRPFVVSHSGVAGVTPHWRNLDDAQIRAVAEAGGVVGVMFQSSFLGGPFWGGRAAQVVDHLEHLVDVGGEAIAALGSDFDGMILPPWDLATCLDLPRLVQIMLDRRWPEARIRGVLGANFLRTLASLRP